MNINLGLMKSYYGTTTLSDIDTQTEQYLNTSTIESELSTDEQIGIDNGSLFICEVSSMVFPTDESAMCRCGRLIHANEVIEGIGCYGCHPEYKEMK